MNTELNEDGLIQNITPSHIKKNDLFIDAGRFNVTFKSQVRYL
jgi:hypothetical protein